MTEMTVVALQDRFDLLLAAHAREHELLAAAVVLARETAEARLNGYIESHGREHQAMQRALDVALSSLEARLAGMNEFRGQMKDMIATLVSRTEWSAGRDALQVRMDVEFRSQENLIAQNRDGLQLLKGSALGSSYASSVDERFKAFHAELASMSRLIWMASGAFAIIVIGLQFIKH